jgi:hypothetical protein
MHIGSMNVVLASTPKQFSSISLGMTLLIYLIGASIGPRIAGILTNRHIYSNYIISLFFPIFRIVQLNLSYSNFNLSDVPFALFMSGIVAHKKGDINKAGISIC